MAFVGVARPCDRGTNEGNRFLRVRATAAALRVGRANGVVHSDNRGRARPAIDQPHLAENLAGTPAFVPSVGKNALRRFRQQSGTRSRSDLDLEDRFPLR